MSVHARVLLLGALAMPIHGSQAQLRFDWTPQEIDCAASIGVTLGSIPIPSDATYVRHLAWLADVVVSAEITGIEHDPEGPYPTSVLLEELETWKGELEASSFTVKLKSGPVYIESLRETVQESVSGEPTFAPGEQVVVFLSKGYDRPTEDPERYALAFAEYTRLGSKFLLGEGNARQEDHTDTLHTLMAVVEDVALSSAAQASNCGER